MSDELKNNWMVAYASVIGNGHIAADLPCQDSCVHSKINETWSVAVVCDGAGSAKHSDIGSDFVARNVAHCMQEVIERRKWPDAATCPDDAEWRKEALKVAQIVRQRLETFAQAKSYNSSDLACTLLLAVYSPFGMLHAHIGDGRAAFSTQENTWEPLIEPFRGDEANETVFITSNIWTQEGVEKFIKTGRVIKPLRAFALLSDGCEKGSFEVNIWDEELQKYDDPNRPYVKFFEPNIKGLFQLHEEQKSQEEINAIWAGFLKAGSAQFKHETDDKTMILAVNLNY